MTRAYVVERAKCLVLTLTGERISLWRSQIIGVICRGGIALAYFDAAASSGGSSKADAANLRVSPIGPKPAATRADPNQNDDFDQDNDRILSNGR